MSGGLRVLIVDDDDDLVGITVELLRDHGFSITGVSTTDAAEAILRREVFDVVVADFFVDSRDVNDSWRAFQRLRDLAGTARVGILTGSRGALDASAVSDVAFLLHKPCEAGAIVAAINGPGGTRET